MNVLVTGGLGFIGTNFLFYYVNKHKEYNITVIDKMSYASNKNTLDIMGNKINFIHGDISDSVFVDKVFSTTRFDYVINFAAETHVDRSIDSSSVFLSSNVIGTQVLLDACRKYKVYRFHQISTDEVYGDMEINEQIFFDEMAMLNPSNPYSASKAAADMLALSYRRTYDVPVTISRCTNNYGPYQHEEKFIPTIINSIIENKCVPIYGSGENIRNWIYVLDHCSAIDCILENGKVGEIYNVATDDYISNLNLTKQIIDIMGASQELISFVDDRKGHDKKYALCTKKIENELGWRPEFKFENEIENVIEWYRNNHYRNR